MSDLAYPVLQRLSCTTLCVPNYSSTSAELFSHIPTMTSNMAASLVFLDQKFMHFTKQPMSVLGSLPIRRSIILPSSILLGGELCCASECALGPLQKQLQSKTVWKSQLTNRTNNMIQNINLGTSYLTFVQVKCFFRFEWATMPVTLIELTLRSQNTGQC